MKPRGRMVTIRGKAYDGYRFKITYRANSRRRNVIKARKAIKTQSFESAYKRLIQNETRHKGIKLRRIDADDNICVWCDHRPTVGELIGEMLK